jgi:hypothetical protein
LLGTIGGIVGKGVIIVIVGVMSFVRLFGG